MYANCRSLILVSVSAVLLAAAAVACGGSDDGQVTASCGAFSGFNSYRYSISVKLDLPGLQTAGPTPGAAIDPYATSLAALLSDFKIDGAFVAPDRKQAILDFRGDQVELREVGGERWERFGPKWEALAAGTPSIDDLAPHLVCTDLVQALTPGLVRSTTDEEEINGVSAQRYSIDGANVDQLRTLLRIQRDTALPEHFEVNVWFASDGDWPVRLEVRSKTTDSTGSQGAVEFLMELRDLNDKGIAIDAPAAAPGG